MGNKEKVRVAFIGAGAMANLVHYPSLAEMPDVELTAIADLSEERLRETADKYQVEHTFTDYHKMLDEVAPDAVYVLMPPHHLFDLAYDCLQRGHAVFIEKPPGITVHQTRALARIAEKKDCLTMTGFQRRFSPLIVEAKRRVEERGPIIQCLARFTKSGRDDSYKRGAVDWLTVDGIHSVDMLRHLGGDVKKVSSLVNSFYADIDNAFNALIEFESGAVGMLLFNFMVGRRLYEVEMHAKNISAYAEPDDKASIYLDGQVEPEILLTTAVAQSEESRKYVGFFAENRHFIDCVKNGEQPLTNFGDGVKTMELVDRIYHSRL